MQGFTAGAVPARRQERSRHTFEIVSPMAVRYAANFFVFLRLVLSPFTPSPWQQKERRQREAASGGGNAAAVHEALGRNQPLFGGDCGPDGVCAWWSPHQLVRIRRLSMPARTALPRHMYACAHGIAPAHMRVHARRTMCPASAKQALAVADRRLRATGQSTGCPTRSCSHLREAKCGTQRTRTRTITAPTVHGRTAHAPILAEIVHAVTAAPTMRAHDAVVATTLHSWPLAHAPMHGTRRKSLESLCGACRSDEPRDVHNRRADRFHECAIRRRRL